MKKLLPLIVEIPYENPTIVFAVFSDQPWSILLDSANSNQQMDDTNRYSYIGFEPFEKIIIKNRCRTDCAEKINDPFEYIKNILANFKCDHHPQYPLFQGGAMGYFSYDLCSYLENIHLPTKKETPIYADLALGLYDVVIAFDHLLQKAWIISHGFPEKNESDRLKKAQLQVERCRAKLSQASKLSFSKKATYKKTELFSSFDQKSYTDLVKKAQQYILEGDIFEVNLSHRFENKLKLTPENKYNLYLKMREFNPSPFSAYLNLHDYQILSTSPERFLLLKNGTVSARPIKGTAPRGKTPVEDKNIAAELVTSEKNRSENIMIVDLLRNDLAKVCLDNSVIVKKLCGLETYPTVHHLVSVIEGVLHPDTTAIDLLKACFPGGSITGAPKIRAMEIIYELEPTPRGPYCGSIGFIGFNGMMDTSITIRTLLSHGDTISYQAGGAIVLDSSPDLEYAETLTKSASIMRTLADGI